MRPDQREQIRHSAKYLREVRPVDPEEINEYVEGRPHPAAVAQVLREEAPALALVERGDGTFVPAPEGPADVTVDRVERLPERYVHVLEDALVERFGPGWPDGEPGDRLRTRIREIKARYHRGLDVEYDDLTALGYAIYHLPATYAAARYVLAGLASDGELPASPRVLDVGAGVGGPALGLCDVLGGESLIEYHAVEPSAAADLLERFLDETGTNFHPSIYRTTAEVFDPEERAETASGQATRSRDENREYDLVVFANVLSELDSPGEVVGRYLDSLAEDGSVVALAPADRNTATGLRAVERAVERNQGATVYAPTVRLWPGETPDGECWSFDEWSDIDAPPFQHRLDGGERGPDPEAHGRRDSPPSTRERSTADGEFVNADVKYAFGIWRTDGQRRVAYRPDPDRTARMADAESFVTERVDLAAIKLSHDLSSGDNPLFLVGDGSQQVDHFAVLTRESGLNRDLATADYGAPLRFENALVLWNDDEGAFNVVVDGETVVDRVPV
jgi:SAM-dependent methyltransferase